MTLRFVTHVNKRAAIFFEASVRVSILVSNPDKFVYGRRGEEHFS